MIRMRLGELLLSRGMCTREQLLVAWEHRVLYGDRLGTNLLATNAIDEKTLVDALAFQHGVHGGHGRVLRVDRHVVHLIPRAVAEKRMVVPHHVVERTLYLLMCDPTDAVAIDEVRFLCGLRVIPIVVAEARMWLLLQKYYGCRGSLRPLNLEGSVLQPKAVIEEKRPHVLSGELTTEDEFNALYSGLHQTPVIENTADLDDMSQREIVLPRPLAEASRVATSPAIVMDTLASQPSHSTNASSEAQVPSAVSSPVLSPPASGATDIRKVWRQTLSDAPGEEALELSEVVADVAVVDPFVHAIVPDALLPQQTAEFHLASVVDDHTPLTFAEATTQLRGAKDRTAIAKIVLRAARSRFARACLLTVFNDQLVGWLGIGDGMETERINSIVIPRDERSVFAFVAETRSHYVGALQRWPLHGAWVKQTGKKLPLSVAVFPILVRTRPVNLIVVDNGHGAHVGTDIGEVTILAQQIAKTYENLLRT